jgi:hypothetical protein
MPDIQTTTAPQFTSPIPAASGDLMASQHWLATVVHVADSPDGSSPPDFADSGTGRWLLANAWRYGFIPALPESEERRPNWEPWKLRWVGREMAARVHKLTPDYNLQIVVSQLAKSHRKASGHE